MHKDGDGNEYDDGAVIYSTTDPGGCFIASGHTHDKTGSCAKGYCGGSTYTIETKRDGRWITCSKCLSCGVEGYAGSTGGGTCTNVVYKCDGSINTWKIGCGMSTTSIEEAIIKYVE